MRILGLETSSTRRSVALVHGDATVFVAARESQGARDDALLPLVEHALAEAGWSRTSLDRVAVGIGPGSFTGVRVGIALGRGLSEGLGVPLIGVGSLQAMALAAPAADDAVRCPVLDARRGELFAAAHASSGQELLGVELLRTPEALAAFVARVPGRVLLLGRGCPPVPGAQPYRSEETDLPHARWVALGARRVAADAGAAPIYVRDDVAVLPTLPDNPLEARPTRP